MSTVISLTEYREAKEIDTTMACECGNVWFELVVYRGGESTAGAVMLNDKGRMTGRMGELMCLECGTISPAF